MMIEITSTLPATIEELRALVGRAEDGAAEATDLALSAYGRAIRLLAADAEASLALARQQAAALARLEATTYRDPGEGYWPAVMLDYNCMDAVYLAHEARLWLAVAERAAARRAAGLPPVSWEADAETSAVRRAVEAEHEAMEAAR